jgi:hypothetical protein
MNQNQIAIISYLSMRRMIGILGISLPIIVVFGGFIQGNVEIQPSISGYYYTNMRDFFVGLLCIVSIFLMSYKGYEKVDNIVGNLSGIFAFGMVLFPTAMCYGCAHEKVGMFLIYDNVSEYIHLTFGFLFFLTLSYNSIFLFTKRQPGHLSEAKRRRNFIYRFCGIVMILSMLCIVVYTFFYRNTEVDDIYPVLIFESIALLAFGISWLIKGNTFFKDQKNYKE